LRTKADSGQNPLVRSAPAKEETMTQRPFAFIDLPSERSTEKPRRQGVTMMVDLGLGLRRLEDILTLSGDYVDLGKIAIGTPRFYDEGLLREKFAIYVDHRVRPFMGGMFIEHYYAANGMQAMGRFYDEATRVGFEAVEVSDNLKPFDSEERAGLIGMARERGLAVFGEVGSKYDETSAAIMIEQAEECLALGCEYVLVEGAELIDSQGQPIRPIIDALAKALDLARVIFELPGPWISGCTMDVVHDMKKFYVREFGADVNIANVMPDDVIETEALRNGLGVLSATADG
jgi:phosphosulfolactate synthase